MFYLRYGKMTTPAEIVVTIDEPAPAPEYSETLLNFQRRRIYGLIANLLALVMAVTGAAIAKDEESKTIRLTMVYLIVVAHLSIISLAVMRCIPRTPTIERRELVAMPLAYFVVATVGLAMTLQDRTSLSHKPQIVAFVLALLHGLYGCALYVYYRYFTVQRPGSCC